MKKFPGLIAALLALTFASGCGSSSDNSDDTYSDSASGRNQPAAQAPSYSPSPSPTMATGDFEVAVDYTLDMIDSAHLGYTAEGHLMFGAPVVAKDYPGYAAAGCTAATAETPSATPATTPNTTDLLVPFKLSIENTASTAQALSITMSLSVNNDKTSGRTIYGWSYYSATNTNCDFQRSPYSGRGIIVVGVKSTSTVQPGKLIDVSGFFAIGNYYAPSGEVPELLASMAAEVANAGNATYYIKNVTAGGSYVMTGTNNFVDNFDPAGENGEDYLFPLDGKTDLVEAYKNSGDYAYMKSHSA